MMLGDVFAQVCARFVGLWTEIALVFAVKRALATRRADSSRRKCAEARRCARRYAGEIAV